ncbi:MAG: thioredoxin family protein [Bacillota bacterium]
MEIKIYGSGCKNCVKLTDNARQALEESGKEADIIKVEDMKEIVEAGIMSTPAIGVDGEIKAKGRVASVDEIKEYLA